MPSPAIDLDLVPTTPSRRSPPRWIKPAIKYALGVVVLVAVGREVARTRADLLSKGETVRLDPGWIAAAVGLYAAGLVPMGIFYGRVLRCSSTPIATYPAVRAYIVSHLGKYVPGKAFVVIVRAGLSSPFGARPATAAFATLYETLTMMAAGGLLAAAAFGWDKSVSIPLPAFLSGRSIAAPLAGASLGLGVLFLALIEPRVFPRLARLARVPFPNVGADAPPRVTWRLLGEGLVLGAIAWTLWGLSLVAVLASNATVLPAAVWAPAVASVALATVVGFVVPIAPGGLGVREWVLWTALASTIDRDRAVVAALVLRMAWVAAEGALTLILLPIRPKPGAAAP